MVTHKAAHHGKNSGATQPVARLHPSWVVVAAGVSAALHVGKLPPAIPVLQHSLGISLVQAGFLVSMVQLAGMALGLVVGLGADGWGLRRSMLWGLFLLAAASLGGIFAQGFPLLLALRAVEGLGFLLVVMPGPALIRRTVPPEHMRTRMGWWGTYMPLGSALALLFGPVVLASWSWQVWWGALGGVSAVAWVAVWRHVPVVVALPVAADSAHAASAGWGPRLRLTLRSKGPWLVALSFAAYASQWIAIVGFLPTVYAKAGLSATVSGLLTALVALVNMAGNVASGRLLQRGWPAARLLRIGFATMAVCALLAYAQWDGQALPLSMRFASVLVFSAVGGLIPSTLFTTSVYLAPSEATVSTTVGFMQQCSSFGQFFAPPLVAAVATVVGGWQWTWVVTGGLCAVGWGLAHAIASVDKVREL